MVLGITTIQRNRGPWLCEWFAFHYLVGFRKFYFYAHLCTDDTFDVLRKICQKIDIVAIPIDVSIHGVQLLAYQHACDNYMNDVDWMAFIDGDEFLFAPNNDSIEENIQQFADLPISALGVYNVIFGSSGHITEPKGLITENYRKCSSDPDFMPNRKVKSIVRGRQKVSTTLCGHIFTTPLETIDELRRPITWGFMPQYAPSYSMFRINHYVCQSYEYFKSYKSTSGHADASPSAIRSDQWWSNFDRNEEDDHSLERFSERLRATIDWLRA
jgi:hypothetical protein